MDLSSKIVYVFLCVNVVVQTILITSVINSCIMKGNYLLVIFFIVMFLINIGLAYVCNILFKFKYPKKKDLEKIE